MSFGGADQKAYAMANGQRQKPAKVTVTTVTSNGGGKRPNRRRRTRSARKATTTTRTTTISAAPRGPGPRRGRAQRRPRGRAPNTIHQTVTATLGTVGSNQGNSVETELVMLMNPALTKETTGSNQFGPIQMYAATYAQWRIRSVRVKATPVVGGSAVSGTVGRMSLNMTGNPTSASWSALGARPHADMVPGKSSILRLSARNFPGPKEGWYNTSTKGDPNMSIGGSLEVHTLGKTMSTYKNEPFTGGLWLLELTAVWEFRNYNPQPGLLNMIKGQEQGATGAQIVGEAGKPIEMKVPSTSRMARATSGADQSEIIWQIADTTVKMITTAFPPPFNWLFQGGWWFIKRVAGSPVRAGEETFRVYASIQDARADVPCIATQDTTVNLTDSNWTYQQVTPGNLGLGDDNAVALAVDDADDPYGDFITDGFVRLPDYGGTDQSYRRAPASAIWIMPSDTYATRLKTFPCGFGFSVETAKNVQDSMLTVDVKEVVGGFMRAGREIDPSSVPTGGPPVYYYRRAEDTAPITVGFAYAFTQNQLEVGNNPVNTASVLFKCTYGQEYTIAPSERTYTCWTLRRTPTLSNVTNSRSSTPVWGGYQVERYDWNMAQNTKFRLEEGKFYMLTYASCQGRISLVLGPDQCGLVSSPLSSIPSAGTWINIQPNYSTSGTFNAIGDSITWTPLKSTRVAFNMNGWQREGGMDIQHLDIIPEEEETEDEDSGYETGDGFEALPDMTESEDENPGCDETDAPSRPPTPAPGPGEHWSNPPPLVLEKMTPSGKKLYFEMLEKGVPDLVCRKVVQQTSPHPAYEAWSAAYHDALVDGCSPPTARSVAWEKATNALGSRGHAE
nr:capsid protein [Rodent astrovirus]